MATKRMTEEEKQAFEAKKLEAEAKKAQKEAEKAQKEAEKAAEEALEAEAAEMENEEKQDETEDDKEDEAEDPRDAKIRELEEMLLAMKQQMANPAAPQVVQINTDTEKVHLLWQAEVADDNVQMFGDSGMFGRIIGKTGSIFVPKSEMSRIMTPLNRLFLEKRWLIVVSGLDEEEREAYGVNYKEGEILDKKAFAKLIEMGDEILNIYPALCAGHKKMVAQRYAEAYRKGNPLVTREIVTALNKLSKEAGSEKGDFNKIIEEMNAADAK